MQCSFKTIQAGLEGGVYTLVLNQPEAGNALSRLMLSELVETLEQVADDTDIRVLVIRANGPVFCTGIDVAEIAAIKDPVRAGQFAQLLFDLFSLIEKCPVPVIVGAHGSVSGNGLGILAAADIVLAADDIRCSSGDLKAGLVPAIVSGFFIRKMGIARTRELILASAGYTAGEAMQAGLITRVVARDDLSKEILRCAEAVLANDPKATRLCKAMLGTVARSPFTGGMEEYTVSIAARTIMDMEPAKKNAPGKTGKKKSTSRRK